jgi:hypothetical protein
MLPGTQSHRYWGGPGSQDPCSLCDQPISPKEVEFEVEVKSDGKKATYYFHFLCHAAWQLECARAEVLRSAAEPKTPPR